MKRVKMVVLIGLAALGIVYAGTRQEEMTLEHKNKLLVKAAIEAISAGDWEQMGEMYWPKFVQHSPGSSEPITWTDYELGCRVARQKMPTVRLEIKDIIAEGNKVAVRLKTIVTYKVNPHGIKTSAEKKEFTEMDLFRIEGGRIVEEWCEYDTTDWKTKMWQLKSHQEERRFEWK